MRFSSNKTHCQPSLPTSYHLQSPPLIFEPSQSFPGPNTHFQPSLNHCIFFFHPFSPHFTYYNFKLTLIHSPSLIFNQTSLLITFSHTFTITFAFFTPFQKFNTFHCFLVLYNAFGRVYHYCQPSLSTVNRSRDPRLILNPLLQPYRFFHHFLPFSRSRTHFGTPRLVL